MVPLKYPRGVKILHADVPCLGYRAEPAAHLPMLFSTNVLCALRMIKSQALDLDP